MSSDPTLASLKKLDDLSQWVIVPNVPIFKKHKRYRYFDETGRRLEQPLFLYEIDESRLKEIAKESRDLEEKHGVVGVLTLGHRDPLKPQEAQPEDAGAMRNPHFGTFGPKGEAAVLADFYYAKDKWDEAKKYPFRSAEFYPKKNTITGVGLLKTDPELDLGMLLYEAQLYSRSECSFYTTEAAMPEQEKPKVEHETELGSSPVQKETSKVEIHPEKAEEFMRYATHCYPHLGKMHGEYAEKYAAAPAPGPGVPAAGNVAVPKPVSPAPPQEVQRMSADPNEIINYRGLQEEVVAMRAELEQVRYERRLAEGRNDVLRMDAAGYIIPDKEALAKQLAALEGDARMAKLTEVATCYQKDHRRAGGPVRLAPDTSSPIPPRISQAQAVDMNKRIISHATKRGISYDEAVIEISKTA